MKIKIFFTLLTIFFITGCFGLKEYKVSEVDSYLKENFSNQNYKLSKKYEVNANGEIGGDTWSIKEVWDIKLNDKTDLKFQVYNYRNCGSIGCSNHLYNNYNYVYANHFLNQYNKSNNLNLIIEKDKETDIYITNNTYAKIYYKTKEELELIKEEITKFQEYLNNNTDKKIELIIYIYNSNDNTKRDRIKIN